MTDEERRDDEPEPDATEPKPETQPDTQVDEDARYTVAEWSGYVLYKCNFCPVGLLDRDAILDHVYQRHERQNAPQPSGLILDSSGNPIT